MGWVWRDEQNDGHGSSIGDDRGSAIGEHCSTRKVVTSKCKTEEIGPGKFVKKCEKTEEILRECVEKPVEVLHSNDEHTEEDVTDRIQNKSPRAKDFNERPINFFNAAEMSKAIIDAFTKHPSSDSTLIEDSSRTETEKNNCNNNDSKVSGHIDLSGLARDV